MTDADPDDLDPEDEDDELEDRPIIRPKKDRSNQKRPLKRPGLNNRITIDRRKNEFLQHRRAGMSIINAMRNVSPPMWQRTYYRWRETDPDFRARDEFVKAGLVMWGQSKPETFAPFRKKYFGHDSPPVHLKIIDIIETLAGAKLFMVLMPPDFGKALSDDTLIPTPTGWTTMGAIQVGDEVFDRDGHVCRVVVKSTPQCCSLRATLGDGSEFVTDDAHRWWVEPRDAKPRFTTTREVMDLPETRRFRVPLVRPLDLPDADLPIDPYVLGVWLGDGSAADARIAAHQDDQPHIRAQIEAAGYQTTDHARQRSFGVLGLGRQLRLLGLRNNKHVPAVYLRASAGQRLALLQGLMDTDGWAARVEGNVAFSNTNERLALAVFELAASLGWKPKLRKKRATLYGVDCGACYEVGFTPFRERPPFRMPRKVARLKESGPKRCPTRPFRSVERLIEPVVGHCIQVDSPTQTFLAGEGMVPTGNSTMMVDWISWKLSMDPNHRVLYISESQKLAVKMLGRVKRRFTDDRASGTLIKEWGPFYEPGQERQGKPWQSSFFTVNGADHDEADYSLEATGWSSQIYGVRSDTIILDDYQTLKGANLTDDMLEKFQQDIITRCDKNGRIFIVGTRIASRDFYLRLLEDDVVDDFRTYPALNEQGESLWPQKWSEVELAERKQKVGPVVWARAYMMRPQADGEAAFTEAMVDACKDDAADYTTIRHDEDVWAGYDAAPTKYSALTIAAVSDKRMRILDSEHRWGLTDSEKHLTFIKEMWVRHHFTKFVIEANAFVKVWARDVGLRRLATECGFQIIEHQTGANKSDVDFGVARMAGGFIDRSVSLNWGTNVRPRIQTLVDELLVWRATIPTRLRTQDMVMASWFVWSRWQRQVAARETPTRQIRIAGTPFTPTGYKAGAFDGRYAATRR